MFAASTDPPRVALRLEDLDAPEQDAVRSALDAAGVLIAEGDDRGDVTLAGPSAGLVAALDTRTVLVVHPEPGRGAITEMIAAGASGVVALNQIAPTLVAAVNAALAGLVVVPNQRSDALRQPTLTGREREVMSLVVMGLTNAEVGRRLHLAESTVKYHLLSVYDKLGVRTRQEATDLVLDPRNGLSGVLGLSGARPRTRGDDYSSPGVG